MEDIKNIALSKFHQPPISCKRYGIDDTFVVIHQNTVFNRLLAALEHTLRKYLRYFRALARFRQPC